MVSQAGNNTDIVGPDIVRIDRLIIENKISNYEISLVGLPSKK